MESSVSSGTNANDELRNRFDEFCRALNLDADSGNLAWSSYEKIRVNYSLDGDQMQWLGCALFVTLRQVTTPSVGNSNSYAQGNGVYLSRLLSLCNLSLIEFFNKCELWMDMSNMPSEYRRDIKLLERSFEVATEIYKKYQLIFCDIFVKPNENQPKLTKSRKQKTQPCNANQLFDFCWILFVLVKNKKNTPDLVTSYHHLLACCTYVYLNVVKANRRDLINPSFSVTSDDPLDADPSKNALSILHTLVKKHEGESLDVKEIYRYTWEIEIQSLMRTKVLKGDVNTLTGILEPVIFDQNFKAINDQYEENILRKGSFDERIFLDSDASVQIGSFPTAVDDADNASTPVPNLIKTHLLKSTPITGHQYVDRILETPLTTPVSASTKSVSTLHTLVGGLSSEPSEKLKQIFSNYSTENSLKNVESYVNKFIDLLSTNSNDDENNRIEITSSQLLIIRKLFFKFLELILVKELQRKGNTNNTHALIENEIFIKCLFSGCVLILLQSYNFPTKYIVVLQKVDLTPYYFSRIIEPIVSIRDHLSRDVVKHFKYVEESILQAVAWQADSTIWSAIESSNQDVPNSEDVIIKDKLEGNQENIKANEQEQDVANLINGEMLQSASTSTAADNFLLTPNGKTIVFSNANNMYNYSSNTPQKMSSFQKPQRGGSLGLFFRKFYYLASARLVELCKRLSIDPALQSKIWTCLQKAIVHHIDLMKNRHLDQIIICSVFLVCKLERINISFTQILTAYRHQPQAASHVYRSVSLRPSRFTGSTNRNDLRHRPHNGVVTPHQLSNSSTDYNNDKRGDLIQFYNTVFVPTIEAFVSVMKKNALEMSPLPINNAIKPSPTRRVTDNITVRSLNNNNNIPADYKSPLPIMTYCFNRSPSTHLENINKMVANPAGSASKRKLLNNDDAIGSDAPPPKLVSQRIQNLVTDREKHKE